MNRPLSPRFMFSSFLLLAGAGGAFAQDNNLRAPVAALGGFLMFFLIFCAAMYIYTALALKTIADKTNTENGWLAWIPIANLVLMLNIAKKPMWWILLFFVPLVNIVIIVLIWMGVPEARQKPSWWGILAIVPLVGVFVPGYFAWAD
jgi:hypothetical protein